MNMHKVNSIHFDFNPQYANTSGVPINLIALEMGLFFWNIQFRPSYQ